MTKWCYIILFLLAVFISSLSQILLKKSADIEYKNKVKDYLNIKVIMAYALFLLATLMTVSAYRIVPLSTGVALETTGYLWVSLLGMFVLKEHIGKKKVYGLLIIITGIIIFNLE